MDYMTQIQHMVSELNNYTKLYDEGHPEISDKEWDCKYFTLADLERKTGIYLPDSPTQNINYQVVSELKKVKHNHPMLSLDKTKDIKEVKDFLGKKQYISMCKMDGLTCSLRYVNGKLVSAETRGNGEVGEDILHNALVIKSIPNKIRYDEELIVDGEIICNQKDFEPFSQEYKNPRNFAAGSIRLLNSKECSTRCLTFVAWDIIKGLSEIDDLGISLDILKAYGFETVPYIKSDDVENSVKELKAYANKIGYPIDGIVFKFLSRASRNLGATSHHFKNAIAYKFYDETYSTNLVKIEWTMGRTGILTPVAVFDPVEIDGSIVERASLHNVSIMHEVLGLYPYRQQPLEIYKANMIIPQIASAKKFITNEKGQVIGSENPEVPSYDARSDFYGNIEHLEKCPCCGESLVVKASDNGILNLICLNPNCDGKFVNKLDHFCGKKGLDIKGLSKMTLSKLIEWGWLEKLSDLFTLREHRIEWVQKPGFGEKSVDKILDAIDNAANNCVTEKLIAAIGIPLIGTTASKALAENFDYSWAKFYNAVKTDFKFYELPNFGIEMNNAILNYDYSEIECIVNNYIHFNIIEKKEETNEILKNLTFVITGKLNNFKNRDAIKEKIISLGGKVTDSVSKNTNYLINNNKESESSKNRKAKTLNIPILSEEEFIQTFSIE